MGIYRSLASGFVTPIDHLQTWKTRVIRLRPNFNLFGTEYDYSLIFSFKQQTKNVKCV